jgi:hypothetical protein
MEVAIAFAVSWKPLVKSKASRDDHDENEEREVHAGRVTPGGERKVNAGRTLVDAAQVTTLCRGGSASGPGR